MELKLKVKIALAALSVLSLVMSVHGIHAGAHIKALETAGRTD